METAAPQPSFPRKRESGGGLPRLRHHKVVPSYPQFSIDDLRKLPIPDFAALGPAAVSGLAAAYDQYADAVLRPLPQMNNCPVRQGLDAAVVAALGLDAEEGDGIRRQLAMEPSVTGRRYAGFER